MVWCQYCSFLAAVIVAMRVEERPFAIIWREETMQKTWIFSIQHVKSNNQPPEPTSIILFKQFMVCWFFSKPIWRSGGKTVETRRLTVWMICLPFSATSAWSCVYSLADTMWLQERVDSDAAPEDKAVRSASADIEERVDADAAPEDKAATSAAAAKSAAAAGNMASIAQGVAPEPDSSATAAVAGGGAKEELAKLLLSLYYSGCYTGRYKALY